MLRIIHTADVHLGARHDDLGEQAAAQREREFAAFKATVDLALSEKVDLFLIAGDLFDSNVQPRRSVERVAAELKRLTEARIRTVIIPGTHDCFDRASIYRAYDISAMAGRAGDGSHHRPRPSLGPPWPLDLVVVGQVFAPTGAPGPTCGSADRAGGPDPAPPAGGIGMIHRVISIPGKTEHDEVVITTDGIAASGSTTSRWPLAFDGTARRAPSHAYPGAPERRPGETAPQGPLGPRRQPEPVRDGPELRGPDPLREGRIDAATVASQRPWSSCSPLERPRPRRCPAGVRATTSTPIEMETLAPHSSIGSRGNQSA
jgi:hypothetical protein